MSVAIWMLQWTRPLSEKEAAALTNLLPPARRERLLRQKSPEKRQEALCAYGLLLLALRREGWTAFPEIALEEGGKPYFPAYPDVKFSISHTSGAALSALSDCPVGADIERIRPMQPETMGRIAGTESLEEFFSCWVRREARSKCTGKGVGTMLRTEPPFSPGECYQEVNAFPGYAAGVAYCSPGPLEIVRLGLEELTGGLLWTAGN